MLGLHPRAGKEDIRRAYKEYVRIMHPDLNDGKVDEDATRKFQKLTDAYNEVMSMTDDQFWLESFDTGITRMATKRVDGPSLNAWERRFRSWARQNDLLVVDDLDEDVDCRKQAKLYLDKCEEDPTLEGCDIARELFERESQPEAAVADAKSPPGSPGVSAEAGSSPLPGGGRDRRSDSPFRIENIVVGGVVTFAGAVSLAFMSIVAKGVTG